MPPSPKSISPATTESLPLPPTRAAKAAFRGGGRKAPPKRRKLLGHLQDDLGKLIARDIWLIKRIGWEAFVNLQKGRGDLSDLKRVKHPA